MSLHHRQRPWLVLPLAVLLPLLAAGCTGDGSAGEEQDAQRPDVTYAGLAGQTCAILVWTDGRTRADFNQLQIDVARSLQAMLIKPPAAEDKQPPKPDPSAPQFIDPRSVVRYQREHPEIDGLPITEVAPHLGVSRVVYVEIDQMQVQSPRSILLLKGLANATLRIVEVNGNKAAIAFEEAGIIANFPPNVREGVPPSDKIDERTIYQGTLVELTRKLALRIVIPGK